MNLNRDKALEAMDVLTEHGYTARIDAAVIPTFSKEPLYRVSAPALGFEDWDMRVLCDLAESIGLHCRYSLQEFRFETESRDLLPV
jgi:hypothetical protein